MVGQGFSPAENRVRRYRARAAPLARVMGLKQAGMSRSALLRFSSSRPLAAAALLTCALLGAACDEEGGIKVKSIDFEGTKGIDAGQLKGALVTKESSRLPWGAKKYFDRSRFDA